MTFNNRMVTLARESAGLTQAALAQAAGVSQALVSQVEHGFDVPATETVHAFARELNVPPSLFYEPDVPLGQGLVDFFHRKRLTLPAKPLRRAHAFANIVRMEVLRLLRNVELSDVAPLPTFPSDTYRPAEAAAMMRATWRVPAGPIPDLVALVEAAGSPVVLCDLWHEKLSAISMPGLDNQHVVILNQMMPASNLRFALAHELGHLVMHVGAASEDMEKEADQFASEFLMPADDIRDQLGRVHFSDLGSLKRVWLVSLAALIYRAHDLDLISDRQYRYLNMERNKLPGGRYREPGEFPQEQPRLIRTVIDYFRERLGYSLADVARVMVTEPTTVRVRYLGESPTPVLRTLGSGNLYQLRMGAEDIEEPKEG